MLPGVAQQMILEDCSAVFTVGINIRSFILLHSDDCYCKVQKAQNILTLVKNNQLALFFHTKQQS